MSKKIINLNTPSEHVCDTEYLKQQADSFAVRSVLIENSGRAFSRLKSRECAA